MSRARRVPDGPARAAAEDFLRHLTEGRGLSPHTVVGYRQDLDDLGGFLTEHTGSSDWSWSDVDRATLRSFLGSLRRRSLARRTRDRVVITDDNMGTEWSHGAAYRSLMRWSR